jgi:hypothetical protein
MSYRVRKSKSKVYFVINTEYSAPDLGLATGESGIRALDFGEPLSLSLSLSLSHIILLC